MLVFLCWLVYTAAYCGRYGYNANINFVISDFGVTHAEAGLVATLFFFAYGAGQVVNGILCRYYDKRYVLGGALFVSAGINLAVFFSAGFASWKYLWLVNGFVQSVLFGGALLIAVAAVWVCFYGAVTLKNLPEEHKPENEERAEKTLRRGVYLVAGMLAVFAVVNNLVKDGLTTWAPSILKETYHLSDSLSIFITLFLPVLGVFGATLAVLLNRKIKNLIVLSSAMFFAVFLLALVVALFASAGVIAASACFVLISALASAINNIITSVAPFYYRDSVNPGTLSGVLNGFCYVGSTVSSYGLGAVADGYGWTGVFALFAVLSFAMALFGGVSEGVKKFLGRRRRER